MKRTLTSKSVLIITAIILLLSLTIIPLASPRTTNFSSNQPSILYYYDGSGFHFILFTEDVYGNPVSETGIRLTLSSFANNFNQTVLVSTDSSGTGTTTISAPAQQYGYDLTVSTN